MNIHQRAETVILEASITNAAGAATSPGTSTTITVTDPDGVVVVGGTGLLIQDMTEDSTGEFHHDYNPAADATLGIYTVRVTAVHSSRTTIQDDIFRLT